MPNEKDLDAVIRAKKELEDRNLQHKELLSLVPNEEISLNEIRRISVPIYGMATWGDLFTPRQALLLSTLVRIIQQIIPKLTDQYDVGLITAIQTCLAIVIGKLADKASSLCSWKSSAEYMGGHTFGRQAIPMVWIGTRGEKTTNPSCGLSDRGMLFTPRFVRSHTTIRVRWRYFAPQLRLN